jgi:nitrite reductase/ring-hydroxylating ferredoxin subunit
MPDERTDMPDEQATSGRSEERLAARADGFARYLDTLLAGGRPSPDAVSDRDEAEMARLAAELRAAAEPDEGSPDEAFLDQLRLRMRQADQGIAAVQVPLPVRPGIGGRASMRVSRRQLLQAGLVGAAGVAAGVVVGVLGRQERQGELIFDDGSALIAGEADWIAVAGVEEVPVGTAVRFSTPAFDGYIVNDDGAIRALLAVCTHMGCTLEFRPAWKDLRCPCHGASFDLKGQLANGRDRWQREGGYRGDKEAYPIELPDLLRPEIRVEYGDILVKTIRVDPNTAGPAD